MSVPAEQVNRRTAIKSAIRRASKEARADLYRLDAETARRLEAIYKRARAELIEAIEGYADSGGSLRLQVLQEMVSQVNARLTALGRSRDEFLIEGLGQAATIGTEPWRGASIRGSLTGIADEAMRFVTTFVAEDGLQLSDRLWRLDRAARELVTQAIEQAVIQGHSASQAAQAFLSRGEPVPSDIANKLGIAQAGRVSRIAGDALMTGDGNPYDNALRVFRTEINRAHGEAYQAAAFEHPDVVGMRFELSPRHPRPDVCTRAGTLVETSRGFVEIERIQVGERVRTHTGRFMLVTRVYRSWYRPGPVIRIACPAASNRNRSTVLTPNHPVLTSRGWIPAGDLRTGCRVFASPCEHRDQLPGDESCTAESDSAQNSRVKAPGKDGAGQCDAILEKVLCKLRRHFRGALSSIFVQRFDWSTFHSPWFRHSTEDCPARVAPTKIVGAGGRVVRTCLDDASHNSDYSPPPSMVCSLSSSTSASWNNLRTTFHTSDKSWASWRGPAGSRPGSRTVVRMLPAANGTRENVFCSSGTRLPFYDPSLGTAPRNYDRRIAYAWFCGHVSIALRSVIVACYRIRRTSSLNDYEMPRPERAILLSGHSDGEFVYNLKVEGDHSYIANGLVVHNCDMHASVNRYGLGPGVYPKGKSPWPAHPNTLSFEEPVFSDEVTDNDRAGKEDRIAWLKRQPPSVQEAVLNSRAKRGALDRDLLRENQILTPWRVLKKRYERSGVDVAQLAE